MNQLTVPGYLISLGIMFFHTLQLAGENIYMGDAEFRSRRISSGHLIANAALVGIIHTRGSFQNFGPRLGRDSGLQNSLLNSIALGNTSSQSSL